MHQAIIHFFQTLIANPIELYNEAGLQHELAYFLRANYPNFTIRLEYPTSRVFNPLPQFLKREIDLYITGDNNFKCIIELKLPTRTGGAVPKQMYHAIEDVKFGEQLRNNDIAEFYSILVTNLTSFWDAPQAYAGIYDLFNGENVNIQTIDIHQLPNFLHERGGLILANIYNSPWLPIIDAHGNQFKYYVLSI